MRAHEARRLLAELGFADPSVTPITGGWASWTFELESGQILRVARNPEIDAAHRREARLLPALAESVSFAVPAPTHFGVHNGLTYMVYRRLPGRGLRAGDEVAPIASMLAELHAFPVEQAVELLGCEGTAQAWRYDYVGIWKWVDAEVLPVLDTPLREAVRSEFDAVLPELADITPALVHRDLGCEHILTDPDTRVPTGIIDFETATVGDPVIDFVGLLITLGEVETRRLVDAWPGEFSWSRLRFYMWMGAVHAIRYGIREGDDALIAEGVEGLRGRLPGGVS
ncbi:MAG: phosphotransferase family protein [Stackebrandtia sp.]